MESEGKKKLFILDGYGLIYRDYFALSKHPLTNSSGQNVSAVHGFFGNVASTIKNLRPDMMAVALDSKTPTFRHKMFSEYKSNRPPTPEDLKSEIPIVEEILSALKMKAVRVDGFEADDVIATLATLGVESGLDVFVLTADKDLLQLVSDDVKVMRPGKKDRSKVWEEVDAATVEEEWGVPPGKILDYLSLTGDTADNVPGVAGVGKVTARRILGEYGSIDEIYEHLGEIKASDAKKLSAGREDAFLSRKLVTLRFDVPVFGADEDFSAFSCGSLDFISASKSLSKWGLSHVARMYEGMAEDAGLSSDEQLKKNVGKYRAVTAVEELSDFVSTAIEAGRAAFDTETDSLEALNARLVGFSLSFREGEGIYVPILSTENVRLIRKADAFREIWRLFSSDSTVAMHNAKFDLEVLFSNGFFGDFGGRLDFAGKRKPCGAEEFQGDLFSDSDSTDESEEKNSPDGENGSSADAITLEFKAKIFDTMIAAWVLNPDRSGKNPFSLEGLCERVLGISGTEFSEVVQKRKTFADVPIDTAAAYSAEDSDFTLRLMGHFEPLLRQEDLYGVFNLEMDVLPVLAKMEIMGIHIDAEILESYGAELSESISSLEKKIFEGAGHAFNISSPRQLGEVLFEEMGLKGRRKTKVGTYSTDEETLNSISDNEFVSMILDFRGKSKLLSTYAEAIPRLADGNSRVHTSFMQTGTATGRLSSRDPNLQNIPVRDSSGRRIREAFTAGEGKVLVSADYSQIELVVLAHLSGDENLRRAFNDGVDVHRSTASLIYGIPIGEVDADMRRRAKTFNFGIIYGMGAYRLSKDLKISFREADEFIRTYFSIYSGVEKFFDRTVRDASEFGFTTTIAGRKRRMENMLSANASVREAAVRMAKNSPIQGSAADIVKKAMVDLDCALAGNDMGAALLLQVHDELILECDDDEESVRKTVALVREKMEGAYKLSVPLRVSVETGRNWGLFH